MTAPVVDAVAPSEERLLLGRERVLARVSYLAVAIAALFLVVTAFEPLRWNWGDPWSDGNVQSSGRVFARDGFVATRFTPILDVNPLPEKPLRYTHYPPLPDLVNGVEQKILGPRDITVYRMIALAMSFAALAFFGGIVRRLWGRRVALFALPLFATNVVFLQYADTIHHVPLYLSTGFGAILAGIVWLQERRRAMLAWSGIALYLCFLASYDFYFFVPMMLGVALVVLRISPKEPRARALALVIFGSGVVAVVTKLGLGAWAVGVHEFVRDLAFQFFERATTRHAEDYRDGLLPILLGRTWRFFGPLFVVALAGCVVAVVDRLRGRAQAMPASPLLVLFAGVPFILLFTQLFCGQYHPTLALVPFFAVAGGALLSALFGSDKRVWRGAAWALFALTGLWQVIEVVRFEKVFLQRDDIVAVRRVLDEQDHRRFVLTNAPADGPVRYYWDRHLLPIPVDRVDVTLRNLFDTYGQDGPLTVIEFFDMGAAAYDKLLYPYFAPERQWGWIANPFARRQEWRARMKKIQKSIDDAIGNIGTVVYQSPALQVRTITLADLDRHQREMLPKEETRFIDFETRTAQQYELYGFGGPEQYELHHGFAWLQERRPARLVFTLQGLVDDPVAPPVRQSALRVRLAPGRDYRFVALGYTSRDGQRLTMLVNGREAGSLMADAPDGLPRSYELPIPASLLRADGVQELEFRYDSVDKFGNGLLFHTVTFETLPP